MFTPALRYKAPEDPRADQLPLPPLNFSLMNASTSDPRADQLSLPPLNFSLMNASSSVVKTSSLVLVSEYIKFALEAVEDSERPAAN